MMLIHGTGFSTKTFLYMFLNISKLKFIRKKWNFIVLRKLDSQTYINNDYNNKAGGKNTQKVLAENDKNTLQVNSSGLGRSSD